MAMLITSANNVRGQKGTFYTRFTEYIPIVY